MKTLLNRFRLSHYGKKRLDIIQVTTHFPPMRGGVETAAESFVDFLDRRKIKSCTLTYDNFNIAHARFADYWTTSEVIRIRVPYGLLKYMIDLERISETYRKGLLHRARYLLLHEFFLGLNALFHLRKIRSSSLIVGQGAVVEGMCVFCISKILRKKYILRVHVDIGLYLSNALFQKLLQMILSNAEALIVNGDDIKEKIAQMQIPYEKIAVTSQCIDTNLFMPRDKILMRRKHNLPSDRLLAVFAGGLNLTKLCDKAIEVANTVLENSEKVEFLFIGEGPLKDRINDLEKRFPQNVQFIDKFLPEEILSEYLSAADVLLLGSVDVSYPSRMVLESLACGTPVIIPNVSIYLEKRTEKIRFSLDTPLVYVLPLNSQDIARFILNENDTILAHKNSVKYRTSTVDYIKKEFSTDGLEKYLEAYSLKSNQLSEAHE